MRSTRPREAAPDLPPGRARRYLHLAVVGGARLASAVLAALAQRPIQPGDLPRVQHGGPLAIQPARPPPGYLGQPNGGEASWSAEDQHASRVPRRLPRGRPSRSGPRGRGGREADVGFPAQFVEIMRIGEPAVSSRNVAQPEDRPRWPAATTPVAAAALRRSAPPAGLVPQPATFALPADVPGRVGWNCDPIPPMGRPPGPHPASTGPNNRQTGQALASASAAGDCQQ